MQVCKERQLYDEAYMARDSSYSDDSSDSDEPVLLMATIAVEPCDSDTWYLDTRCSNHMTSRKEWIVDLDDNKKGRVHFADDRTLLVAGVGNIMIKCRDGKSAIITDVLLVPDMKSNLLSMGQLLEKGLSMKMQSGCLEVLDPNQKNIMKA